MATNNSWQILTWRRTHATHGMFFVGVDDDGTAQAQRVHGGPEPRYQVEDLLPTGRYDNAALAMIACEQRIAELDQAIVDDTCADLRAYATRVA
jgi:hypothetical protein